MLIVYALKDKNHCHKDLLDLQKDKWNTNNITTSIR